MNMQVGHHTLSLRIGLFSFYRTPNCKSLGKSYASSLPRYSQRRLLHRSQPKETAMGQLQLQQLNIQSQSVDAPLTQFATFLVLSVKDTSDAIKTVRSTVGGIEDISKNVTIRDPNALFTCTVGIGSDIWDRLTGLPRPVELHPFKEVKGKTHTAVSTPGDLFFHIRAQRRDLCFEFERQLMDNFGESVSLVDQTQGFRYFDARDLLGFVDGTANPTGPAASEAVLVSQDHDNIGGSYVVVQKYLHDMPAWKSLSTDAQEGIIGRTKADNIELDDAEPGKQQSHKSLNTIEDADGEEHEILRDNMPFGSPASGEFGTFFIGYTRDLWVIEKMLERMFIGDPPGMHDRILDFSKPLTGTTFFAPSANVLAALNEG